MAKRRPAARGKPVAPKRETVKASQKGGGVAQVRACARQVIKALGKGHTERVYHRALITMFNRNRIQHRSEVLSPILFLGEVVGFGRCDLVVKNLIIELKANRKCPSSFSPQLIKYMSSLKASERRRYRGVILNFNQNTGLLDVYQAPLPTAAGARRKKKKGQ